MTATAVQDSATVPSEDAAEPGSLPKRIVDTFFSPGELFSRFGPQAPWGVVLLISTLLTAGAYVLLPTDLLVDQMRAQMAGQPEAAQVDPAQMATFARLAMVVGPLIMVPVMALITAGLLTLIFRVVMDGEAGFRQYLAVVSHAALVGAVGVLLTVGVAVMAGDAGVQLSLALVAPVEEGTFLYRFLTGMNVFTLWAIALYGVGAGAMNRRVNTGTAIGVVLSVYVVLVVAISLLAGLFGA